MHCFIVLVVLVVVVVLVSLEQGFIRTKEA